MLEDIPKIAEEDIVKLRRTAILGGAKYSEQFEDLATKFCGCLYI